MKTKYLIVSAAFILAGTAGFSQDTSTVQGTSRLKTISNSSVIRKNNPTNIGTLNSTVNPINTGTMNSSVDPNAGKINTASNSGTLNSTVNPAAGNNAPNSTAPNPGIVNTNTNSGTINQSLNPNTGTIVPNNKTDITQPGANKGSLNSGTGTSTSPAPGTVAPK